MKDKAEINAYLKECFEAYQRGVYNYCLARLGGSREAADDCVQETFLVFNKKLLGGEEFENPRAFLYRTADNFIKRSKKKTALTQIREIPLDSLSDIGELDISFAEKFTQEDYDLIAEKILNALSDGEMQIYKMRYVEKMSVESIAAALGITRPTASMRLLRIRNKVKETVYEYDFYGKGES